MWARAAACMSIDSSVSRAFTTTPQMCGDSMLSFGHIDDETVEGVRQCDLTGETRTVLALRYAIQHFLFGHRARSEPLEPGLLHIDVAGGARAIPAAISVDARHPMVGGSVHQRCARRHFDRVRPAREADKGDFGHAPTLCVQATFSFHGGDEG